VQRLRSHLLLVLLSVYPLSHDLQTWSPLVLQAAPVVSCPFEHVHSFSEHESVVVLSSMPASQEEHFASLCFVHLTDVVSVDALPPLQVHLFGSHEYDPEPL